MHSRMRLPLAIASLLLLGSVLLVESAPCSDDELAGSACHALAYCEKDGGVITCSCPEGFLDDSGYDDGTSCTSTSYGARTVCNFGTVPNLDELRAAYCDILSASESCDWTTHIDVTGNIVTINALYESESAAQAALDAVPDMETALSGCEFLDDEDYSKPAVYAWTAYSTGDPIPVRPSGFDLDSIFFKTDCLNSGCWVVDVTYTTGGGVTKAFNAFYLPRAVGNDALSYDFNYDIQDDVWPQSPEDTFTIDTHPCTTSDFDAEDGMTAATSSCCLEQFLDMYRPVASFQSAVTGKIGSGCGSGGRSRSVSSEDVVQWDSNTLTNSPNAPEGVYVGSVFEGLSSYGEPRGTVDSYIGIYKARFFLDEVELRQTAGMLKGTVGVEHTVDTFLGLLNLRPTGSPTLDTFATQVAIHLEKTSFFTVSTHGTNDYTFLEYVNLRLVSIYTKDENFADSGDESGDRTIRTDSSGAAHYVQVTFTLGEQYTVNDPAGAGLIPLDSVRAGQGEFFSTSGLDHKCMEWEGMESKIFTGKEAFEEALDQNCAPAAAICDSPDSIDDSFVSFNIPLGIDFFEQGESVFVDMVINALDSEAAGGSPNLGDDAMQMKTTLTASIPVVQGGLNIFCDGYTAKTDLKDVANVDIVVGSAKDSDELTRLMIKKDIASTQLSPDAITNIDSASIEAGLMTLVIKGNSSYFDGSNTGRLNVHMVLEDVITIHIMESDGDGSDTEVSSSVMSLITDVPDDNSFASGLDTDGYYLNGAFYFDIDRAAQRAYLEPSEALLAICPFNPPRPNPGQFPLETCVTRRDVRYRGYPSRTGAKSTAMEICPKANEAAPDGSVCPVSGEWTSFESKFFVTMFGDNEYAKELAIQYSNVIDDEYQLNGRYRRAYWINPGYEWTPTQTGGTPIFSVSQKLYLFALVTLDEGLATLDNGEPGDAVNVRRRALLQQTVQDALKDGNSNFGGEAFEFQTSPSQLMAKAFKVPEDRVATFSVGFSLTDKEACMTTAELQSALQGTLADYLKSAASAHETVQVTKLVADKGSVKCSRRAVRSLLSTYSDATADVTMLVVFSEGDSSVISLAKLKTMPGIQSVAPLGVSAKIDTTVPADWSPNPAAASSSSSNNNAAIIGGAVGGGAALLVIGAAAFFFMRKRTETAQPAQVQAISVANLKSQLADDV